ncbi:MAG: response regulator [Candidatus Delongbacteria bacterium]
MKKASILYLEDDDLDVELIRETLKSMDFKYSLFHVQNKSDFKIALKTMKFDLILADFSLPDIDGYGILYLVKQINPDIPTIILSGTINEDIAIDTLKHGAVDYIFKSKLDKLIPSIESAMIKGEANRRKRKFEKDLILSEAKFRTIFNNLTETVLIIDPYTMEILEANDQIEESFGFNRMEVQGKKISSILGLKEKKFPESETLEQLYLQDKGVGKYTFFGINGESKEYDYKLKIIPWQDSRAWMLVIIE